MLCFTSALHYLHNMSMAATEFICYGAWKLHLWLLSFCDPEMNNSNWKCFCSSTKKRRIFWSHLLGGKKERKREVRASCFLPDSTVCISYNFTSESGWVLHFSNYRNYMCAMNSLYWVWGEGKGGRTTSSQREHRIFQPMCLFLLTL